MNSAAQEVYKVIRSKGTQKSLLKKMQTRKELYRLLDYQKAERTMDRCLGSKR